MPGDAYRDAFNEASSELQEIFGQVERLRVRRDKVARLVDVLDRRFGFKAQHAEDPITWRSRHEGLTVATRMTIVRSTPEIEK